MSKEATTLHFPDTDAAFLAPSHYGTHHENTFSGALSFMRRRYTRDLAGVDYAVTGIPFDLATSNRPGTRFGPAGIRAASAHLAWGAPWPWGFDPFDRIAVADYGDCHIEFGHMENMPRRIEQHAEAILAQGTFPISLGGDHYISLPLLRAHAQRFGPLSLVHFDAHSDTWRYEGDPMHHGSMFRHAVEEGIVDPSRSVQVGIRTHNSDPLGFTWLDADWVHENGANAAAAEIVRIVGRNQAYLTFDIDCLDPAYAPGTGTPVVGGLTTRQAQLIIGALGSIEFTGMDMVEVSPVYDHAEVTSLAAASLILDFLCMRSQNLPPKV